MKTTEQIIEEIISYHGCCSGDCPHEMQLDCYRDLMKHATEDTIKHLTEIGMAEFDRELSWQYATNYYRNIASSDEVTSTRDIQAFSDGAEWGNKQTAAQIGALRAENEKLKGYETGWGNQVKYIENLKEQISDLTKRLGLRADEFNSPAISVIDKLEKEIAALKAQLKEKVNLDMLLLAESYHKEITELKRQLAEKESYIQKLIKDGKQRIANSIMKDTRITELEKEIEILEEKHRCDCPSETLPEDCPHG